MPGNPRLQQSNNRSMLSSSHDVQHGVFACTQWWSFSELTVPKSNSSSKNIQRSNAEHKPPEVHVSLWRGSSKASGPASLLPSLERETTSPPGTVASPPAQINAGLAYFWSGPDLTKPPCRRQCNMPGAGALIASEPLHTPSPSPSPSERPHLHQGPKLHGPTMPQG